MTGIEPYLIFFLLCLAFALGFFDQFARTASSHAWKRLTASRELLRRFASLRRPTLPRPAQAQLSYTPEPGNPDAVDFDWRFPNRNFPRPRGARLQKRDAA